MTLIEVFRMPIPLVFIEIDVYYLLLLFLCKKYMRCPVKKKHLWNLLFYTTVNPIRTFFYWIAFKGKFERN